MEKSLQQILLVDDEPDILEFLSYNLIKEGYKVETASDGLQAIEKAKEINPDLIIMDIMMPKMDGLQACREIKKIESLKETRIAFLTARNEDPIQIEGLEIGGDDYIAKPIRPKVFLSRIKALLRRKQSSTSQNLIEAGQIQIDTDKHLVIFKGIQLELPKKEFDLLKLLISKPGKVFKRENILQLVWGQEVVVGDRTIDVHIRKLRERFGEDLFKTVKGVGYKFEF